MCKSPLTGGWGDANCGGTFGAGLKFAGLDAVFFTGVAERPIYLEINDGQAELHDAADLWGQDSNDTEHALQERHGKGTEVASIGPAGEKLVLSACIINDEGRAWGRSGVGAVMGSKQLKAVTVKGKRTVPVADPERTKELRKEYMKKHVGAYDLFKGTPGITADSSFSGDTPIKNWRGAGPTDFPQGKVSFEADMARGEYQDKKYGCWICTIGLWRPLVGEERRAVPGHLAPPARVRDHGRIRRPDAERQRSSRSSAWSSWPGISRQSADPPVAARAGEGVVAQPTAPPLERCYAGPVIGGRSRAARQCELTIEPRRSRSTSSWRLKAPTRSLSTSN